MNCSPCKILKGFLKSKSGEGRRVGEGGRRGGSKHPARQSRLDDEHDRSKSVPTPDSRIGGCFAQLLMLIADLKRAEDCKRRPIKKSEYG